MSADQMRAYRATVNGYVEMLLTHCGIPYTVTVDRLYRVFGIPEWNKTTEDWLLIIRIQVAMRRMAERIARTRGWMADSWLGEKFMTLPSWRSDWRSWQPIDSNSMAYHQPSFWGQR